MPNDESGALYVEAQGSGIELILAHGFGGSARNFRPQARALKDACRIVTFDARGHARSPKPLEASAYEPDCFVSDLQSLIGEAGEGRAVPLPVIGGLSMGAGIALRYAIGHSDRISALLLASFPRASVDAGHREWALGLADAIEQSGLEAAGERFVWGERSRFDPKGAALIRQGFLEHSPVALAHTLRRVIATQPSPEAMREELAGVGVPVLLIAGERDAVSRTSSEELLRYLPQAELVRIADAGHVVNLEAPRPFNDALRNFLSRVQARGSA
jgi:2-succinyl-6-hydroxy-2,4-cyclohexadiene-1-carboxylate synthase